MTPAASHLRIGMVLDKPYPPDPRVHEEARCLLEAGHRVFLFCFADGDRPLRETCHGVEVRRHRIAETFRKKAGALSLTVPLYGRWFRRRLPEFLEENGIDVLHIHDLRLAGEGFHAARRKKIPWILDLHENLPAILPTYHHAQTLLGRLLIRPSAWKRFETKMVRKAFRTVVVTEAAAEELRARTGLSAERIVAVPNVASRRFLERPYAAPPSTGLRLLYIGDTGRRRGTDLCIEAVASLKEKIPGVELTLVGTSLYQKELERLARRLGIEDRVHLLGWQQAELFPVFIEASHAGLAPFRRNLHHDTTYANKLFQYMALGRPVVASDCTAQKLVVESERCGLVFRSGDASDLARRILELSEDGPAREAMGRRGWDAARARYNWDVTGGTLVRLYEGIAGGGGRRQ